MAVYIPINGKDDVLYGLLVTYPYINKVTLGEGNSWSMHIYESKKGRHQGSIYQKRQTPTAVLLAFEIKVADLIKEAKMIAIIPREINRDDNALSSLRWGKK